MKNIAIIPARGGSKRIPKKNIRSFFGKPILQYSIEAALTSNLFDEVMVSTESEEIAKIARAAGGLVPFMRSEETANDFAGIADVIVEVLQQYKELQQREFDNVCCIFATSPFTTKEKLEKAFRVLHDNRYDSVFTVSKFSYPIKRALTVDDHTNRVAMIWPEYLTTRSQDIPDAFHDCGQFYWADTRRFLEHNSFFTPNTGVIELSPLEFQDIDNEEDWLLAEMKFQISRQKLT